MDETKIFMKSFAEGLKGVLIGITAGFIVWGTDQNFGFWKIGGLVAATMAITILILYMVNQVKFD